MTSSPAPAPFSAAETAALVAVPTAGDDKYSRGVLGVITGSAAYPGAAVLGVDAALHAGVGMVRYVGPERAQDHVLHRRPEAVTGMGRVQAWLVGSGIDQSARDDATTDRILEALGQGVPCVVDAGALDIAPRASGPVVLTPHAGELARITGRQRADIEADPAASALAAASETGAVVLLKGSRTHVAAPDGTLLVAESAPAWLATAGSGDALGGILGALVATHADGIARDAAVLPRLAAAAAVLHGMAGERASGGGPVTVSDLSATLPGVIADLLRAHRPHDVPGAGR